MGAALVAPRRNLHLGGLLVPSGHSLSASAWEKRHRGVLVLLFAHAVGLAAFGVAMGAPTLHALFEGGIVAAIALVAKQHRLGRRAQSVIASFGLMSCSAILVHLSGGYIEAHFHFFVMLGVIFLYEDWLPYVLSVGYVAVHHGVAGTLDPRSVFNHPAALADPWGFAGIHALFVLGLSAALIVAWNVIEHARVSESAAHARSLDLKRELQSQEKMAALGSLVSGLAHEVRTPLAVVASSASLLEIEAQRAGPDSPLAARVLAHVGEIQASVDRMNALVLQLRKFHQLAPDELVVTPLHVVVQEAVRLFSTVNRTTREVRLELAETPPLRLHQLGVHQIVLNLLSNAVEATSPEGGRIVVRTALEERFARLEVEDNGSGMDERARARAFDPLFTTKEEGMGLGLHIVRRIVFAHGGDVHFESEPGRGTTFIVRFPLLAARDETVVPVQPEPTRRDRRAAAHG